MNTVSALVLFGLYNPNCMNAVRILFSVMLQYISYDMIKRKAAKNQMREGLYTHYLCIQTKMMMLTPSPLDGQIAASNQIFAQNGVFLGGMESVCDKGGELQLGYGEVYIT